MVKATADIRSLARAQTELAIRTLTGVCGSEAAPAAARVSAAQALLDRGWGKAPQAHTGEDGEGEIKIVIRRLIDEDNAALNGRVMKTIDQDVKAILGTASGAEEE
jgi:hypothetical protein